MQPWHLQLSDGLHPCFLLLVERHTHHLEALGVVLVVGLQHVGHLSTARTAPRGPEVDEHILALAHQLANLVHLAVGVGHLQVGELLAYEGHLLAVGRLRHGSNVLLCLLQVGMVGKHHLLLHQVIIGLHAIVQEIHMGESQRNERLALLLEHPVGRGRLDFLHLSDFGHEGISIGLNLIPGQAFQFLCQHPALNLSFQVVSSQALVQRRALQRTVVQVDNHRRAIVEEHRLPLIALQHHGHAGILVGRAAERELAAGNRQAVNLLLRQLVYQIDFLTIVSIGTADRIFQTLCHRRQRSHRQGGHQ